MHFMVEGLRDLFFFGKGISWSSTVSTLFWIGLVSILVIIASGCNPQTGEEIEIAASKVPSFKAGKKLKAAVKS